jgi:hypothetical protein
MCIYIYTHKREHAVFELNRPTAYSGISTTYYRFDQLGNSVKGAMTMTQIGLILFASRAAQHWNAMVNNAHYSRAFASSVETSSEAQ